MISKKLIPKNNQNCHTMGNTFGLLSNAYESSSNSPNLNEKTIDFLVNKAKCKWKLEILKTDSIYKMVQVRTR